MITITSGCKHYGSALRQTWNVFLWFFDPTWSSSNFHIIFAWQYLYTHDWNIKYLYLVVVPFLHGNTFQQKLFIMFIQILYDLKKFSGIMDFHELWQIPLNLMDRFTSPNQNLNSQPLDQQSATLHFTSRLLRMWVVQTNRPGKRYY